MKFKTLINLVFYTLIYVTSMFSQSDSYGDLDYSRAINMAGKQRMLSQKIAKTHLLITKGMNTDDMLAELNSSIFIFEKQFGILSENTENATLKAHLKKVEEIWVEFKQIAVSPNSLTNSQNILKLNTKLLNVCHDLVLNIEAAFKDGKQLQSKNSEQLVEVINISGKQRMLSQRICLYYTALHLFPDNKSEYQEILSKVFDEFNLVMDNLIINEHGIGIKEIKEELNAAKNIWSALQLNKTNVINNKDILENVFKTTNDLTTRFNKITGIYEIIAKTD